MGWRLQEEDNINSEKLDQIIDMVGLLLDESREKPVERLLTKKEAQELRSCSERTINYHLFEKKDIPYLKVGKGVRIKSSDLSGFIDSLQGQKVS